MVTNPFADDKAAGACSQSMPAGERDAVSGSEDQESRTDMVFATRDEVVIAVALGIVSLAGLQFIQPAAAAATAYLIFAMVLVTVIDRRHFIIPDILSLPAVPLGLLANLAVTEPAFWSETLTGGITATAVAAGVLLTIRAAYWRIRGIEGLGLGDVKLAAAAGAWTGLDGLAATSLLACVGALAAVGLRGFRQRSPAPDPMSAVPFGSFIAPAIVLVWLWQVLSGA